MLKALIGAGAFALISVTLFKFGPFNICIGCSSPVPPSYVGVIANGAQSSGGDSGRITLRNPMNFGKNSQCEGKPKFTTFICDPDGRGMRNCQCD